MRAMKVLQRSPMKSEKQIGIVGGWGRPMVCIACIIAILRASGAFASDGFPEVLLQENGGQGQIKFWYTATNSATVQRSVPIQPPNITDPLWRIKGTGEFNRLSSTATPESDLLIQYNEGSSGSLVGMWFLEGINRYKALVLPNQPGPHWAAVGAGDFNHDGNDDVVFQNRYGELTDRGMMAVWFMNSGGTMIGSALLNPMFPGGVANSGWDVKAVTDWNGDGHADLVFQHSSGYIALWLMIDTSVASPYFFTPISVESGSTIRGAGLVPPLSTTPLNGLLMASSAGQLKAWAGTSGTFPSLAVSPVPYSSAETYTNFSAVGLGSFNRLDYADSDYDGRSDIEEGVDGTDAFNPASVVGTRLARWTFNGTLNSTDGRAPISFTPNSLVTSANFDGQAFYGTGTQRVIYRDVESGSNRSANLNTKSGTIRLFYKPDWNGPSPGGTTELRLLEMGPFSLSVLPDGNLELRNADVSVGSVGACVVKGKPTWFSTPDWYEIGVSYSPNVYDCLITVNGVLVDSLASAGVIAFPHFTVRTNGLCIGNSADGTKPARGLIDEVETFNYPMKIGELSRLWEGISATVLPGAAPGLRIAWSPGIGPDTGGLMPTVLRRKDGETSFVTTIPAPSGYANYVDDTTVVPGQRYEYKVGARYFLGGVGMTNGLPLTSARGRMILVPAANLWTDLSSGILATDYTAFKRGLVGDGWDVVETAPQPVHPSGYDWCVAGSAANLSYKSNLLATKNAILALRDSARQNLILLLGHVTVPYSGTIAEDGHVDCGDYHTGAWPADSFYGVSASWFGINDSLNAFSTSCGSAVLNNYSGDGKFDDNTFAASTLSARIEMPVGRIDLSGMTAFASSETGLMQRYFQKVNGYRALNSPYYGSIPRKMTTGLFFGEGGGSSGGLINQQLYRQSRRISNGLFGTEPSAITYGDIFTNNIPSLWATMGGYGAFDAIRNLDNPGRTSTQELASNTKQAKALFLMLDGSWSVDWNGNNGTNNFLKAVLSMNIYGLSAQWSHLGATLWDTLSLGAGDTLADSMLRTITRNELKPTQSVRATFILGDPSLRTLWSSPPGNVRKDMSYSGSGRKVLWDTPMIVTGTGLTYHVFRAAAGSMTYSSFSYLGTTTSTSFTDTGAASPPYSYWIRASTTVTTGSGSFVDLGQAGFGEVN